MDIFHGLSAYALTPTDARGDVLLPDFAHLIERLIASNVDSICVLGSTGIYPYLTLPQRKQVMAAAAEITAGRVPLIMGIGALRSDWAAELAQEADRLGAQGGLLAPVSYQPLTEAEAYAHYAHVAGASDLPICIYNNPGTTHFRFTPALLAQLAALPQIAAVKMPSPEAAGADQEVRADLAGLRAILPRDFAIGYSADPACGTALLAGADGFHSGIAGVLPEVMAKLARAGKARDGAEVARLNQHLEPLWALCRQHGGMRGAYAIANYLKLTDAQPPRPILPIEDHQAVSAAIKAAQSI